MKLGKQITLFAVGGSAYVGLELLYRGRSHISMFGAGGLCFLLIGALRKRRIPGLAKLTGSAAIITGVELATGLLCNRDYSVWDYRGQPGNFLGQICPLFAAVWIPVGAAGMTLHGLTEALLDRKSEHPAIQGNLR